MTAGTGRRPALDGLRACAVVLVLLQHALVPPGAYGSAGVLLFFALSGYLITGLLVEELDRTGRVDLARFSLRRAGRLLPGLAVMVLLTTVAMAVLGDGWRTGRALSAVGYVENYVRILAGQDHPDWVLGHTWSLAVEEHFYLLWPLLLVVLHRRLTPRALVTATLAICVLAQGYRFVAGWAGASDDFFDYDSLSHADALLYGAAAALAVRAGWRPGRLALVAGAGIVVCFAVGLLPFVHPVVVPLVLGIACALLVAGAPVWLDGAFRGRGWRWVADRSYSLYLWHFPLIAMALELVPDSRDLRVLAVLVSVPVACASYALVEMPVRARLARVPVRWSSRRAGLVASGT